MDSENGQQRHQAAGDMPLLLQVFLTQECYHTFMLDGDLFNMPCWQLVSSKIIGLIIIATSSFVKMPQLLKIFIAGSAEGVSFLSQLLVLITTLSNIPYCLMQQYPLSVWGEGILLGLQTAFITFLVLWYSDRKWQACLFLGITGTMFTLSLSPAIPMTVHKALQLISIPLLMTSKINQIWTTYSQQSAGQLSSLTVYGLSLRTLGRLYTYITETGDPYKIATYLIASLLNLTMTAQLIYYNNKSRTINKKQV